jgi:hypothetical protein
MGLLSAIVRATLADENRIKRKEFDFIRRQGDQGSMLLSKFFCDFQQFSAK